MRRTIEKPRWTSRLGPASRTSRLRDHHQERRYQGLEENGTTYTRPAHQPLREQSARGTSGSFAQTIRRKRLVTVGASNSIFNGPQRAYSNGRRSGFFAPYWGGGVNFPSSSSTRRNAGYRPDPPGSRKSAKSGRYREGHHALTTKWKR